jgi:hypothetical protein
MFHCFPGSFFSFEWENLLKIGVQMFGFQFYSFVIYFNFSGHNLLTLMKYKNGLKIIKLLLHYFIYYKKTIRTYEQLSKLKVCKK